MAFSKRAGGGEGGGGDVKKVFIMFNIGSDDRMETFGKENIYGLLLDV